jgi:tryptophan synthase alpha chain
MEESHQTVRDYLKGGVDVIETDFPAEDPYYDSDMIKERMWEALRKYPDYDTYMESIETILKEHPGVKLYILIYERTILTIGIDKFVDFMKRNNLEEMILVGTEFPEVRERLIKEKFKVSAFIQFHAPDDQIELAKTTTGFIYLQASSDGRYHPEHKDLKSIIKYLRYQGLTNEINCGIGIHTYDDLRMVKEAGADGAFIGTQVLLLHGQSEKLVNKVKELKAVINE